MVGPFVREDSIEKQNGYFACGGADYNGVRLLSATGICGAYQQRRYFRKYPDGANETA